MHATLSCTQLHHRGHKFFDSGEFFLGKQGIRPPDLLPGGAPPSAFPVKKTPTVATPVSGVQPCSDEHVGLGVGVGVGVGVVCACVRVFAVYMQEQPTLPGNPFFALVVVSHVP